jgi:FkbM family methyltransferase
MNVNKFIPLSVKRYVVNMVREKYIPKNQPVLLTEEQIEYKRLSELERFKPTSTKFLGHTMEIVDACTFLGGKEEIFDKGIYEFRADTDSPLIIDCGANIGLSIIYFKQLYPKAKILAFEPDQQIFNTLQKNINSFKLSEVTLYQEAIWKEDGETEFKIEGGFSGRIPKPEDTIDVVKVKARRLKNLLNQPVEFLKIDIEGAEYEVLKDCANFLGQVKNIFIEYHSHITERQTLNEILSLLTESGFRYHIHEAYTRKKPYVDRELMLGMDLQLNIYGYRR